LAFINTYNTASSSVSGMLEVGENAVSVTITDEATTTSDNLNYTAASADLPVFLYDSYNTITNISSGTVTTSAQHFFAVGDTVYISGSSNPAQNGIWVVATKSTTTFTCTGLTGDGTGGSVRDKRETIKKNGVTQDPSTYTWSPWYSKVTFNSALTGADTVTISGFSYTATLTSHQPSRIIVRHCIFDGEADLDDRVMVRAIIMNAKDMQVYDSHLQGFKNLSSDSQAISGWSGYGPFVIQNNYMGGATENFFWGGAVNTLGSSIGHDLTYKYNYNPHESYMQYKYWAAGTWYRKGTVIKQDVANNNQYIAASSGTSGSSAPTWDTTIGNTTTDNTVTWTRLSTARHYPFEKNNFELKQMDGATIQYNYFPAMLASDQGCSINIKVESNLSNEGGTPFNQTKSILFENNVIESGYCAFNASTNEAINFGPGDGSTAFGNITVNNNLFRYFKASNIAATKAGPCGGLAFSNFGGNQTLQNYFTNNLIDAWQDPGTSCTSSAEMNYSMQNSSNWIFRNNIMTRTQNSSRPGFWGASGSETEGSVSLRIRMQNVTSGAGSSSTPIAAGRWTNNVMSGAPSGKYPNTDTSDTGNTNYTTAQASIGFRDTTKGNFRLRTDSTYRKGSYQDATKDLGPNWFDLPLMENFKVTYSDREAVLSWNVTPAIKDIPCVATFGTRDLLTLHGDMDPLTYTIPNADNNDIHVRYGSYRMIRVGSRVALTPSTEYGYRVECGGYAVTGYFTTLATLSSTTSQSIDFVPTSGGTQTLTWGTTYSRATGSISGGAAPTATCSAGAACSISFTGNKGQTYYYKVNSGRVQTVTLSSSISTTTTNP
jgi:hypothetical protein